MSRSGRRTLSSKVPLLLAFAILTFALGLLFTNPLIFVCVPVLLYLAFAFLQSENLHSELTVTRTLEKSLINEEEELKVRLSIVNTGNKLLPLLRIQDLPPPELLDPLASRTEFTLSKLRPGEKREVYYVLKGKEYGIYQIGPITLRSEDSFGLAQLETTKELFSTAYVLPEATEKLKHFRIQPKKTKPWPGEIAARRIGQGMDNFSIRQYLPGDSFRRINWKASARVQQEQLLLNEQMAELGADTIIIVDARPVADVGKAGESTVVSSIHAAISLSDKLLRDRNRVGLITIGYNSERIPPGYGRRQYNRMLFSLIKVRPGEFFTFENISRYLSFFYPNLAQVIFISSLIDEDAFSAAAEVARMGYELLVLSPNPIDYSLQKRTLLKGRLPKLAIELAELSRSANLAQLRKVSTLVVDWRKGEPLDNVLSKNVRAWRQRPELLPMP